MCPLHELAQGMIIINFKVIHILGNPKFCIILALEYYVESAKKDGICYWSVGESSNHAIPLCVWCKDEGKDFSADTVHESPIMSK